MKSPDRSSGPPDREPEGALVLASASPRRREILKRAGIEHEVLPSDVAEVERPGESPEAMALRLAREKALAVARRLDAGEARLVLGADTIVVLDETVLGKPRDAGHAREMLARLTGREHEVITGVALVEPGAERIWQAAVRSRVTMRAASADEIRDYVETGEPLDKAGSYGIQGEGGRRFVRGVVGSESNVMGLPIDETRALLARARGERAAGAPAAEGAARAGR